MSKLIENELNHFEKQLLQNILDNKNQITNDLNDFLFSKSKRLRPKLIFLFSKALNIKITDKIYKLACAVELIHNSTLIHDDIVDNSEKRRGKESLNHKLGNGLSVLAGDVLLSLALKNLSECNDAEIINIFSTALCEMCLGEINQSFEKDNIPTLENYIKKSENKTAELFKAPLISLCKISQVKKTEKIKSFATNFGIAFQIKDDLINILQTDSTKPILSDIYNGIYTAPVIYLYKDRNDIKLKEEIIQLIQQDKKYINQTIELIKEYAKKAIESLTFIEDNQYKKEIIEITENLYKAGISE